MLPIKCGDSLLSTAFLLFQ